MPAFGDMIDPFDEQALHVLEDKLELHCFCRGRPSDFCPIHNGKGIVEALHRLEEEHEEALTAAREEGAAAKEEELRGELEEAREEAERAEERANEKIEELEDSLFELGRTLGKVLAGIRRQRAKVAAAQKVADSKATRPTK